MFSGFMVCNSPLKQDTASNIKSLQEAKYTIVMITGDNLLTAANVGKQINLGQDVMTVEAHSGEVMA